MFFKKASLLKILYFSKGSFYFISSLKDQGVKKDHPHKFKNSQIIIKRPSPKHRICITLLEARG